MCAFRLIVHMHNHFERTNQKLLPMKMKNIVQKLKILKLIFLVRYILNIIGLFLINDIFFKMAHKFQLLCRD